MGFGISFSGNPSSSSSSSSKDFEEVAPINQLCDELLYKIFSTLSDIDRANAREVCKEWSVIIKPKPYPYLTAYGKTEWEKYFGYVVEGEVPKLPPKIIDKVEEMRSQLKGLEEAAACSLILMPKGLTLNKLMGLINKPKEDRRTSIRYIWEKPVQELGDKTIDKTCWMLFYEGVIEGSRGKSYEEQKTLIKEKTDSQCEMPKLLEVMTGVAFERAKTGKRLFNDAPSTFTRCEDNDTPSTFTRCEEKVDGWPLVVGGFSSSGLGVVRNLYNDDAYGVAACRKF